MAKNRGAASGGALRITVVNGDLSFVSEPLLIGHYRAKRLTGTEAVLNERVGRTMEQMLALGNYPTGVGTHQIFLNRVPREDRLR